MKRTIAIAVVLMTLLTACSSIESELAQDFTKSTTVQGNAYWSVRTVAEAAIVVSSKQKPLDTVNMGTAQFLQYSDAIVAIWDCSASDDDIMVTAGAAATGSDLTESQLLSSAREGCLGTSGAVLYVDEYQRSRSRWFVFVGRRFGTNVGSGSSFRGRGISSFGK